MKKQGLVVTALDAAEAARWRQIGAQVTRDMEAAQRISTPMLNALRKANAGAR